MIKYDTYKGFCYGVDETGYSNRDVITTNGLDQLNWEELFPDIEDQENVESSPTPIQDPRKKLSKSEKKEQRQLKKINAARNRQLKQRLAMEGANPDDKVETFNPFLAKSDLKSLYSKIIAQSGKTSKDEFKVFQYQSIAIYKSDLDHILPGEWLNDNNISLIYELINLFVLDEGRAFMGQIQLLFPSLVHLFLHFPINSAEDLEGILPIKELRKSKFIFIPINFIDEEFAAMEEVNAGDHWALCLLSLLENKLYVYDSMSFDDNTGADKYLEVLVKRLSSLLVRQPITVVKMKCDQQNNFDDCGVYIIMITCYLVKQLVDSDGLGINLDMSNIRLNPLSGRLQMMQLIYEIFRSKAVNLTKDT